MFMLSLVFFGGLGSATHIDKSYSSYQQCVDEKVYYIQVYRAKGTQIEFLKNCVTN